MARNVFHIHARLYDHRWVDGAEQKAADRSHWVMWPTNWGQAAELWWCHIETSCCIYHSVSVQWTATADRGIVIARRNIYLYKNLCAARSEV